MGLWALGACVDLLHTDAGDERIRGALWAEGLVANQPTAAALVITNSPLPCAPATDEDDATTEVDEAAIAHIWWEAELGAALSREGAAALVVWMPDPTAPFQEGAGTLAGTLRVDEAELATQDGVTSTWTVTERTLAVASEGDLRAEPADGGFDVDVAVLGWSATTRVARCDEPALAQAVWPMLLALDAEAASAAGE